MLERLNTAAMRLAVTTKDLAVSPSLNVTMPASMLQLIDAHDFGVRLKDAKGARLVKDRRFRGTIRCLIICLGYM
jgi:hypothetical protein